VVPVEIDGTVHQVYVLKRPYVDEFLQRMGELYECVLFTASLAKVSGFLSNCIVYLVVIVSISLLIDFWIFLNAAFQTACTIAAAVI
jgi:hypothetical protein